MQCTKAIIPVAGFGTRRLPITKVIEKCMLPILNRPIIDYVVEDCIKAGISDIYFVVSPGASQVREYYEKAPKLEQYLKSQHKEAMMPLITPPTSVQFHFVQQDTSVGAPYGTSVPVWLCREFIEPDEHVLVLMGDDFIYNADGSSEAARLLAAVQSSGASAGMLGVEVLPEQASHYGVIESRQRDTHREFVAIQEKPAPGEAKSNLVNISKYLFDAAFFAYVDKDIARDKTAEYHLTDVLNAYVAAGNAIAVVPAVGEYLDSGNVVYWLYANQVVAQHELS
ncbi:MAG: sugar phosphate nucleotidyltransferase [Candidatus Saccharibacteria bacterium]